MIRALLRLPAAADRARRRARKPRQRAVMSAVAMAAPAGADEEPSLEPPRGARFEAEGRDTHTRRTAIAPGANRRTGTPVSSRPDRARNREAACRASPRRTAAARPPEDRTGAERRIGASHPREASTGVSAPAAVRTVLCTGAGSAGAGPGFTCDGSATGSSAPWGGDMTDAAVSPATAGGAVAAGAGGRSTVAGGATTPTSARGRSSSGST
jgi:hypothetical protein